LSCSIESHELVFESLLVAGAIGRKALDLLTSPTMLVIVNLITMERPKIILFLLVRRPIIPLGECIVTGKGNRLI